MGLQYIDIKERRFKPVDESKDVVKVLESKNKSLEDMVNNMKKELQDVKKSLKA